MPCPGPSCCTALPQGSSDSILQLPYAVPTPIFPHLCFLGLIIHSVLECCPGLQKKSAPGAQLTSAEGMPWWVRPKVPCTWHLSNGCLGKDYQQQDGHVEISQAQEQYFMSHEYNVPSKKQNKNKNNNKNRGYIQTIDNM